MTWQEGAAAASLVWFGMVLAISFIEAPLKFRAPGITTQLGLGIGRIVFRALNIAEIILALVTVVCLVASQTLSTGAVLCWIAVALLVGQLAIVKPVVARISNRVLAEGDSGRRSRAHLWYVALEVVKVVVLLVGPLLLLAA